MDAPVSRDALELPVPQGLLGQRVLPDLQDHLDLQDQPPKPRLLAAMAVAADPVVVRSPIYPMERSTLKGDETKCIKRDRVNIFLPCKIHTKSNVN